MNLSINSQALLTNDRRTFRKLTNVIGNSQEYNRIKLKVNDQGALYLVSYYTGPDNSQQYNVDYIQAQNTNSSNQLVYNLQNRVTYQNKNQWQFQLSNGIMVISKASNGTDSSNIRKLFDLQGYQLR